MTKFLVRAAFAAAFFAAPIAAQTETRSTTVAHADLDLSRRHDVDILDLRIARAAKLVCGEASQWDLAGQNALLLCRRATIAAFVPRRTAMIASARTRYAVAAARD